MITNSAIAPEITTALQPRKPLDANRYATKKTIAQGMLDIALLTANASQLKYILQIGDKHEFYSLMLGLITTSIILQVGIGVLFLSLNLMRDCRLHLIEYKTSALIINNLTLAGSFAVTCLNLLVSAFDPSLGRIVPMCVGILFLIIGGLDINIPGDHLPAAIINDIILVLIFVISIVNVIISGFGMEHSSQPLEIVIAAAVAVVLMRMDVENADQNKVIANLNHVILSCSTISMLLDVVKLGFGFEDAVPVQEQNVS